MSGGECKSGQQSKIMILNKQESLLSIQVIPPDLLWSFILQGQALCQLSKTVADPVIFGTASSGKHEALKAQITHLYDHGADYTQEIRKWDHWILK